MSDDRKKGGDKGTSELLGDLESIRSLLDEGAGGSPGGPPGGPPGGSPEGSSPARPSTPEPEDDENVPLLEDVVHGGVSVNETFLSGEGDFADSGDAGGLDDDIFKALLSDEWRETARELLDQARAAIDQHQDDWTPAHTDELNQALQARIDATLQQWLHDVVRSRIDELRARLERAVSEQIRITVDQQFNQPAKHEDPDGA